MQADGRSRLAASQLISNATIAALMGVLARRGILTAGDVREVFEDALLQLERQHMALPTLRTTLNIARKTMEDCLNTMK